jgi:hypothetical protein
MVLWERKLCAMHVKVILQLSKLEGPVLQRQPSTPPIGAELRPALLANILYNRRFTETSHPHQL